MASRATLEQALQNPNVRKFLDLLSYAESTTSNGYLTAFGGGRLSSLADHPRYLKTFKQKNGKTNKTSAAGRYQFLRGTWDGLARQYGFKDFGPKNQDLGAVALLAQNGALPYILKGDWGKAVSKAGGTWASLPSSPHPQPTKSWQKISDFLGGKINILASGQAQAVDPRLAMSAPELLKTLRKDGKMNDNQLFVNLAHGNGRAAQEIRYLLNKGHDPADIAEKLGLNIKMAAPPPSEQTTNSEPATAELTAADLRLTPDEIEVLGLSDMFQAQQAPEQPISQASIGGIPLESSFITHNQPQQIEQPEMPQETPKPTKFDMITAELPKLKEQGLSPYQALYTLAQRDDDIGTSIRGAFGDGMNSEQMANYFGVNDIWQSQNEPSSNTLQIDEQREYQTPILSQG